eukprot:1161046-Pelagomonas_calceolata.AAC.3
MLASLFCGPKLAVFVARFPAFVSGVKHQEDLAAHENHGQYLGLPEGKQSFTKAAIVLPCSHAPSLTAGNLICLAHATFVPCTLQRKMKGKNKPSKRHRKKQNNIIEEKKPQIKAQKKELVVECASRELVCQMSRGIRALKGIMRGMHCLDQHVSGIDHVLQKEEAPV